MSKTNADSFRKADFLRYIAEQKHIMLLYDHLSDYRLVASSFIADGLSGNDRSIMATKEYARDMVVGDLAQAGVDVQAALESGQLLLIDAKEHYGTGERFDPDAALERWQTVCAESITLGFDKVRGVGEAVPALGRHVDVNAIIYYENIVNQSLFPDYPFMSLGAYNRKEHPDKVIKAAIQSHPMLVHGTKIFKHNIYYVPPERFFSDKGTSEIESWLENVEANNQRAQELVRKEEEIFSIFNGSNDAFLVYESSWPPGNFIKVNKVACKLLGYSRDELMQLSPLDISTSPIDIIESRIAEMKEKGAIHFNTVFRTKSGETVPVSMSSRAFPLGGVDVVFSAARDISAQQQAEMDLMLALEVTNDGIWEYDLQHEKFSYSKRWADMLGYEIGDIPEQGGFCQLIVHPADKVLFERTLEDFCKGRSNKYALEVRLRTKDGSYKRVYSRGRIVARDSNDMPSRILGADTDITEQKRIEESLRKSEQRFRMLYDDAPVSYQSLDVDGNFVAVNKEFCRTLGYKREELIGRNFADLLHPDWVDHFRENFPRFKAIGEVLGVEFHMRKKDGEYILVSFTGRIGTKDDGSFRQTHCVFRDITREREYENQLIMAKDAAEEANLSKSMFLANMSHELRTPLSGIAGMHQLLQSTDLTPEQDEYVSMAIRSAKRLSGLLGDILDLTKIETGKMGLVEKPFKPIEITGMIEYLFGPISRQKGIDFDVRLDESLPSSLKGDSVRLQQIINNLVGNSIKFTEKGRISLEAWGLPPTHDEQCRVLFMVSDTGIGIPDDKIDFLFDAFTQVDVGYKRAHQGAGLGLSIVRQLVALMGGNLSVSSEAGKGTTFYLSLPFGLVSESAVRVEGASNTNHNVSSQYRVLLAEDEAVNRLAAKGLLRKMGYEVTAVENGAQALEELQKGSFDLLFMDIQMPVMDGLEATRAIREGGAGSENATIPIVALTAYSMAGDKEKFLKAGVDGYLAKPMEMEPLIQLLNKLRFPPKFGPLVKVESASLNR